MHENGNLSMTFNGFEPCADANMESVSLKMGILGDVNDRQMRIDYTSTSTTTEDKMIGWTHEKYPADGVTYTFVQSQSPAKLQQPNQPT